MQRLSGATIGTLSPPLKPNMINPLARDRTWCASRERFEHVGTQTPVGGTALKGQPLVRRQHRDGLQEVFGRPLAARLKRIPSGPAPGRRGDWVGKGNQSTHVLHLQASGSMLALSH